MIIQFLKPFTLTFSDGSVGSFINIIHFPKGTLLTASDNVTFYGTACNLTLRLPSGSVTNLSVESDFIRIVPIKEIEEKFVPPEPPPVENRQIELPAPTPKPNEN